MDERICFTRTLTGTAFVAAAGFVAAGFAVVTAVTFFFVVLVAVLATAVFTVDFLTVLVVFLVAFFVVAFFLVVLLLLPPVDLAGIRHLLHATLTRPVFQICDVDSTPPCYGLRRHQTAQALHGRQVVNLRDLAKVKGEDVTPASLLEVSLIAKPNQPVKILGSGEVERSVAVRGCAVSKKAREKIEAAGGRIEA